MASRFDPMPAIDSAKRFRIRKYVVRGLKCHLTFRRYGAVFDANCAIIDGGFCVTEIWRNVLTAQRWITKRCFFSTRTKGKYCCEVSKFEKK